MNCQAADTSHQDSDDEPINYETPRLRLDSDCERQIKELTKKIEELYTKIINNCNELQFQASDVELAPEPLEKLRAQCRGIIGILRDTERTRIFIGSTSQGKSTFINAFLRRKVLPSGLGSTTSHIVEVRGHRTRTYNVSKSMRLSGSGRNSREPEDREFKDAETLGEHVLDINRRERDAVRALQLRLPLAVFPMLRNNVVLIDSPGMGYEDSYNEAVSRESKSVRTVILVCNLETDLTQMDMEYMRKLCDGATPAVCFIVMNKWDRALEEIRSAEERQELRAVQTERCVKFLVEDINMDPEEAHRRVFFLSGLAVLHGEPQATESFEEFFRVLQLKEEEALSLRNMPEHQKSVNKMVAELSKLISETLEKYDSAYSEMKRKVHHNEIMCNEEKHVKQTLQLKIASGFHDVVGHYAEKMDDSEAITEAQAKVLLRDFIRTAEDNIDTQIQEELAGLCASLKEKILCVVEGGARDTLQTRYDGHTPTQFSCQLRLDKRALRYLDVLQWDSFKVTHTLQSDMKEMKRTLGSLRESFQSRQRAKEAAQEAKEAKVAYTVATQKVMLEISEEMENDLLRRKTKRTMLNKVCWLAWCCGACSCLPVCQQLNPCGCRAWRPCRFCGCLDGAQDEEAGAQAADELSQRVSQRIMERSKKIQHDLRQDRLQQEDPEETEVPLLEIPEVQEERRLSAAVREEYRDRLNKVQKLAPELTHVVQERADQAVEDVVKEILGFADQSIDGAWGQTKEGLETLLRKTKEISVAMEALAEEAAVLFADSRG